MAFALDLTSGSIKTILRDERSRLHLKPFLQILQIQNMATVQKKLNSERYKLLLSDGVNHVPAVLSPKLNHLVYLKSIQQQSIVKLIEYELHIIKTKPLLVVLNMEEIISTFLVILGSPVPLEIAPSPHNSNSNMSVGSFCSDNSQPADAEQQQQPQQQQTVFAQLMSSSFDISESETENIVNSLSTDFLHLFNNPELSDITFALRENQKCFAHKNILITRSTYFRSMFLSGMKESFQQEIEINAWDPEIFMAVLKFIYSDQIVFSSETQTDKVWALHMAAKYYNLDRLLKLCEQFLIGEKLDLEGVCLLWNTSVSVEIDAKQVAAACRKYFETHFEAISTTEGFSMLNKELFLDVLGSEDLIISSQEKVSEAVLKWGRIQMSKNDGITKQELFCQFFPLLRMRRKWAPMNLSLEETKNAVLKAVVTAGIAGLHWATIQDNLNIRISNEDVKNTITLLQNEGKIFAKDGETVVSSEFRQKRGFFRSFVF